MQHVEFWSLVRVAEVVGLSKSTIYGLMKTGQFPQSNCYRFSDKRRFWLSHEVKAWQQAQLDREVAEITAGLPQDDFESLLA